MWYRCKRYQSAGVTGTYNPLERLQTRRTWDRTATNLSLRRSQARQSKPRTLPGRCSRFNYLQITICFTFLILTLKWISQYIIMCKVWLLEDREFSLEALITLCSRSGSSVLRFWVVLHYLMPFVSCLEAAGWNVAQSQAAAEATEPVVIHTMEISAQATSVTSQPLQGLYRLVHSR